MEKEQNPTEEFNNTDEDLSKNTDKDNGIENAKEETLDDKDKNIDQKLNSDEKIKELEDKLTRTLAEMENQRRRFEKEKGDAFDYGGFSFAKEALSLIDNLERSKQSLINDEDLKNSSTLNKILEHFNIISKDLISVFEKNDIKPIESIDKKLDPNLHQAMMEIEDDQKETGTIIKEIQKGFLIKNRLLRPSLVGVSRKKMEKETNDNKKSHKNKEKQEEK